MTVGGTARVTLFLLAVTVTMGAFGWQQVTVTQSELRPVIDLNPVMLWVPLIGAFVSVMVAMFVPRLAPPFALAYAVCEGFVVGQISHIYESQTHGIVVQAVAATAGVAAVMAVLYSSGRLRPTPRMRKVVVAATLGIMLSYLVGLVGTLFGANLRFWDMGGPLGIAISLVIVAVAAFNLLLDFEFIQKGESARLPRQFEWVGALGLLVTLVWLYLEILRLLGKARR